MSEAFSRSRVTLVRQPIQQRRGHPLAREHLAPVAERQVARDQQARSLVAVGEHLKQQLGPRAAEREVAQLVADQQFRPVELPEEAVELVLLLSFFQAVHQRRRREESHPPPLPARGQAQGDRQMGLPSSGLADQATIEVLIDPFAPRQLDDLLLGGRGHGREVEGVEILPDRERRAMDAGLEPLRRAGRDLDLGQAQEILLIILVGGGRLTGQLRELGPDRRQPELLQVRLEQLGRGIGHRMVLRRRGIG